jgi:NAD(P)-dependent dehydrogenase (short-subunit alcohol dehydrogenase family)
MGIRIWRFIDAPAARRCGGLTGAASGIGRALAIRLAQEGMALALADWNAAGLEDTVRQIYPESEGRRSSDPLITTHVLDVSSERAVEAFASDAAGRHRRVALLINNAGVALHGDFEEISQQDFEWLMGINFWGTVYGVRHFLPILRRQPQAHIVNVSSVFGLMAYPGQAAYCASKFAVRGFTEALRHELAETPVRVSCVHPGGVHTQIAEHARLGAKARPELAAEHREKFLRMATTSAEAAAARIVRGILRDEPRIRVGADAWQIDAIVRLLPGRYSAALFPMFRRRMEGL